MREERVVVGVGKLPRDLRALTVAATETRLRGLGLRIVHVLDGAATVDGCGRAADLLGQAKAEAHARGAADVTTAALVGSVERVLTSEAVDAMCLIVGRFRRDSPAAVAPVATRVAERLRRPLVVVPSVLSPSFVDSGNVVLAIIDDGPESRRVLEFALREAEVRKLELTVLRVATTASVLTPNREQRHSSYQSMRATEIPADVSPARSLVTGSAYAEMMVVGRSHGDSAGLDNGITDLLIRHSLCPVAVV